MSPIQSLTAAGALALGAALPALGAVDEAAAAALARNSGCLACHSVAHKKDAPSYKEIAGRYKTSPGAEKKLAAHLTSSPKVKVDGIEVTHPNLKATSEAEVRNLVAWILSR